MASMQQSQNERQDYETPPDLFKALEAEFGPLDLDSCAVPSTAKLPRYWTPEDDALVQDWSGLRVWMNPPYGRGIGKWVEKARTAALAVCLLPARTDTRWWQDNIGGENGSWHPWVQEVRFLRGRVNFWIDGEPAKDPETGRPAAGKFPSAVVILRQTVGDGR